MTGPVGPPGHNGSQGSAGPAGASGPPGPKGAGDFSSCQYKVKTQAMTPGFYWTLVSETEPSVSMKDSALLFFEVFFPHYTVQQTHSGTNNLNLSHV